MSTQKWKEKETDVYRDDTCGCTDSVGCDCGCTNSSGYNDTHGYGSECTDDCNCGCNGETNDSSCHCDSNGTDSVKSSGSGGSTTCTCERPVSHKAEEVLVHDIVKTAVMGVQAVDVVEEYIENKDFKQFAVRQKDTYQHYSNRINDYMHKQGFDEDFFGSVQQAFNRGMIKMSVMGNTDDSVVAEQLIKGTNMGIDCLTKTINNPWGISDELLTIAKDMQAFMLDSLDELRNWL